LRLVLQAVAKATPERVPWFRRFWSTLKTTPTDRLSHHVESWIKDWNKTNPARARKAYPGYTKALHWCSEHLIRFIFLLLAAAIGIAALEYAEVIVLPGLTQPGVSGSATEQLARIEAIWTVQTTLAALVYPIVLAFVALLFQRRHLANAGLQAYLVETGAIVAGMSSVSLVLAMGIGYLLIVLLGDDLVKPLLIISAPWLVMNLALTAHFLLQTLRHLNDDNRLLAYERYTVHVAIKREIRRYLPVHMLWHAQDSGLLPGRSSSDDFFLEPDEVKKTDPRIDLVRFEEEGTPCVHKRTRRLRHVRDVRLRTMRWGLRLWLRRVRTQAIRGQGSTAARQLWLQSRRGIYLGLRRCWHRAAKDTTWERWSVPRRTLRRRQYDPQRKPLVIEHDPIPVLALGSYPGDSISGRRALFRVRHAVEPGWLARHLLAESFVLGPLPEPDSGYVATDLLRELMQDLIDQTPVGTEEAIRKSLRRVTHLHSAALDAGAFVDETGAKQNAAIVVNPTGFPGRSPSRDWVNTYNDWLEAAVTHMGENANGFRQASLLTQMMIRDIEAEPLRIAADLLQIHRNLFFYLRKWKQKRIRKRSEYLSGSSRAAGLSEHDSWLYDRALTQATGTWQESRHLRKNSPSASDTTEQWRTASVRARFIRKHLELTAELIIDSLSDTDTEAAESLTEAFLAWPQAADYRLGNHLGARHSLPFTLSAANLDESWAAIKSLAGATSVNLAAQEIKDLCGELLLKYWFDLRFVLTLLLMRRVDARHPEDSSLGIVLSLLRGPAEDWRGIDGTRGFYDPERVLLRLIRIIYVRFAYKKRLDKTCDHALRWNATPDQGYPDFSNGYTDLSALKRPLMTLLYALAPKSRFNPKLFDRWLVKPNCVFDAQMNSGVGDARFLKEAWQRALKDGGEPLQRDAAMVCKIRHSLDLPEKNPNAKRWVQDAIDWMDELPKRLSWAELEIVKDADGFDDDQ
jgi:hypothetical protein